MVWEQRECSRGREAFLTERLFNLSLVPVKSDLGLERKLGGKESLLLFTRTGVEFCFVYFLLL